MRASISLVGSRLLVSDPKQILCRGKAVKKILFVCVENAGRSQMAEAFANYYGKDKLIASSAGNKPSDQVNPIVVEAMKEKGIDISTNKPKLITFEMTQDADLIVTMGCNGQGICPGPFFKPTIEWKIDDPKGKPIEKVREIRDEIERRIRKLLDSSKTEE
jgi:arsenate reductase